MKMIVVKSNFSILLISNYHVIEITITYVHSVVILLYIVLFSITSQTFSIQFFHYMISVLYSVVSPYIVSLYLIPPYVFFPFIVSLYVIPLYIIHLHNVPCFIIFPYISFFIIQIFPYLVPPYIVVFLCSLFPVGCSFSTYLYLNN